MPEFLWTVGQFLLWVLLAVATCIAFMIVMTLGQYEFRPQRRKRKPRPAGQKPNPPRVDTNVQPPSSGSNLQPPREVRCAEYEALGGTPMYREGKIVGYEWQSKPNAEGLVQTGRLVKLEDA